MPAEPDGHSAAPPAPDPGSSPGVAVGSVASVEQEIGQIARGAGLGLGGNAVNTVLSYLFGILVARQIGAEDYGLYTLGVTAVTLISRFAIVGLDRGLMRYASISRGEGKGATLRRLIRIALAAGALFGLVGGLLLALFPAALLDLLRWSDKTGLVALFPILALAVPTMTLTGVAIAGTQAFRTMRYRALIVNVVQPIVKLVVALALIPVLGPQAAAPVWGFAIAQILGTLLSLAALSRLSRRVPAEGRPAAGTGRNLARFSAPLMLANVVEYLNGRTEILVLGMFLAADAAGIYHAAARLAGLGLLVLTAFNAIFSPLISDLHNRAQLDHLSILFKLVTRWVTVAAMPLFVVQMLFAPQLMSLFGAEFVAGAVALRILSVGQLVNFSTGAVGIILIMSGRSDITFLNSVLTVAVALALDFWLVPSYGLPGAALAGATILALINLLRLAQVWWLLRIHPFDWPLLKPFLAALPAFAAGLAWRQWLPLHNLVYLGAACGVVGLVYVAGFLVQRLDDGDRMMIESLRRRALGMLRK